MAIRETEQGIFLTGYVGDDWEGFTAEGLAEALAGKGDVTLYVNSVGGIAHEGAAIHAVIARHPGRVTAIIEGVCLSAASLAVMSADRIGVSGGAILMIHDPANITFGNADAHRMAADVLDTLADEYARLYAKRCGRPKGEVRDMMRAETWFAPEEAVDAGFADFVEEAESDSEPVAFDYTLFRQTPDFLARMARERGWTRSGRTTAAPAAQSKEAGMPKETKGELQGSQQDRTPEPVMAGQAGTQTPEAGTAPQASGGAEGAAQNGAAAGESHVMVGTGPQVFGGEATGQGAVTPEMRATMDAAARRQVVMGVAHIDELTAAEVEQIVQSASDPADAKMKAVDRICEKRARAIEEGTPVVPNASVMGPRTQLTRDEGETRMEGIIGALMGQTEGPAADYRGIRIRSLAMSLAGNTRGFNDVETIRRGMVATTMRGGAHGVSDFAYITTEVMNRSLIERYQRAPSEWQAVTGRPVTANDFRELHAVRFGGDFQLKTVKENGEYEEAVLADEAEGLRVERRGRTIKLTFEAVINDDMSAFAAIPEEFGFAARLMESQMVWTLIRSNAKLKSDNTALFHTSHKNLAASGSAISVDSVGAGRAAMYQQTAFGSKKDSNDFLMIRPDRLIVPVALETAAAKFLDETSPTKDGDTNPWKRTLTMVTAPIGSEAGGSDAAWYLVSSQLPPISHAYLSGYETPTVETKEGMNPDLVQMNARHVFGAAAVEFRGAYKNPGA